MISRGKEKELKKKALAMLEQAGLVITAGEFERMEVVDFGLGAPETFGLQIVVYENNDRYCAKELVLLPRQTCMEHRHPPVSPVNPGKRETFRCRRGEVYLHVPGKPTERPRGRPPGREDGFSARREIVLGPGDQFTLEPDTPHWFQAGDQGAIVSEFSSASIEEADLFSDPGARRITEVRD